MVVDFQDNCANTMRCQSWSELNQEDGLETVGHVNN